MGNKGKIIIYLIAGAFVLRFMIAGAVLTSIPFFNTAFAQQKSKKSAVDITKITGLDYEVLKSFEERKKELDRYEEKIKKREAQLSVLKEELDDRLITLEKIRSKIEKLITTRKDLSERSLKHLVKVYESMKPEEAAPLIERLDRDITIEILSRMKGKNVGKILSKVKQGIATKISEQIVKKK